MPEAWEEFAGRELGSALGVSARDAEEMLDLARHLEVNLPGTRAAFRTGILNRDKAQIIANVTALLDPGEARRAEAMVLDRAGSLTPGGLRAAIQRAVMEVAPKKAQKRREHAARLARVERWGEDSGNAGLAGRELPPAQVLAADQRVSAWAKELRKAGMDGDMDVLRARAFLDISAPRGAVPYRPRSGQGREELSLDLMADLDLKGEGDSSMPANRQPGPGVWGGVPGDPRDMAKAGLP